MPNLFCVVSLHLCGTMLSQLKRVWTLKVLFFFFGKESLAFFVVVVVRVAMTVF